MRPWQTILILIVAAAVGFWFFLREEPSDPRLERFVDCYVDLAIFHACADTTVTNYRSQRDSVLNIYGFTEEDFRALKAEHDSDPESLVDIWGKISEKLREREKQLGIRE
ncbi:MAG: hypothetical protein KAT58_03410 [candidate division Zixibacteria bacterium]|nr:hypothetical protein [candidate division Zixibacteria bacterium]